MALKVKDFYTDGKLRANLLGRALMHDTLFCVLVELNGTAKELAATVTRKYHYEMYKSYNSFIPRKANEFNVIYDFLLSAKKRIMDKWNLSERDYEDLLVELELCLVRNYSDCSTLRKFIMYGKGIFKKFVNTVKWRFGKCSHYNHA